MLVNNDDKYARVFLLCYLSFEVTGANDFFFSVSSNVRRRSRIILFLSRFFNIQKSGTFRIEQWLCTFRGR